MQTATTALLKLSLLPTIVNITAQDLTVQYLAQSRTETQSVWWLRQAWRRLRCDAVLQVRVTNIPYQLTQ
jgi:hypothetical protein